jgi:hypothetical protein
MLIGSLILSIVAVVMSIYTGERAYVFTTAPIGVATILAITLIYHFIGLRLKRTSYRLYALILIVGFLATMARVYTLILAFAPFILKLFKKFKAPSLFLAMFAFSMLFTFVLIEFMDVLRPRSIEADNIRGIGRLFDVEIWKFALYGRAESYLSALGSFLDHPLVGIGLFKGEHTITEHNFHIEWLIYGGLIGYSIYIVLFLSHVITVNRHLRKHKDNDPILLAGLVALMAILLNSVTNGFMHGLMPLSAFIVMGISEARIGLRERGSI